MVKPGQCFINKNHKVISYMYIESDRKVAYVISAPTEHSWSDCTGGYSTTTFQDHPPVKSDQLCPLAQIWRHVSLSAFLYDSYLCTVHLYLKVLEKNIGCEPLPSVYIQVVPTYSTVLMYEVLKSLISFTSKAVILTIGR